MISKRYEIYEMTAPSKLQYYFKRLFLCIYIYQYQVWERCVFTTDSLLLYRSSGVGMVLINIKCIALNVNTLRKIYKACKLHNSFSKHSNHPVLIDILGLLPYRYTVRTSTHFIATSLEHTKPSLR